jgi:threonine synthase
MSNQKPFKPTPHQIIDHIIFKQEYLNPTGSIKDRGINHQIHYLQKQGINKAVISSSGNAAISAAYFCNQAGISLTTFLSPKINPNKLNHLKQFSIDIQITPRPISSAFRYAKETGAHLLRPSKDPQGPNGYQSLGQELAKLTTTAVFFPVSSGTTLAGTFQGYLQASGNHFKTFKQIPQFHIVQSTSCHPLASRYDQDFTPTKSSLADALVAKSVPRKNQVIQIVNQTQGSGWVISDSEITKASRWLSRHKLKCSPEGAAALAAIWKAKTQGWTWPNPIVCLLTGKKYPNYSSSLVEKPKSHP